MKLAAAAVTGVLGLLVACGEGRREVQAHWPSGALRAEGVETRAPDGGWVQDGPFRSWHEGGGRESEGAYAAGLRSGPWTTWHPPAQGGGLRSQGSYLFGQEEGVWVHRRPDGSIDPQLTGIYEAGERLGDFAMDGPRMEWFGEGRPREATVLEDGLRHGPATTWYPSGAKRSEGVYVRGRKSGRWSYWQEDGSLDRRLSTDRAEEAGP